MVYDINLLNILSSLRRPFVSFFALQCFFSFGYSLRNEVACESIEEINWGNDNIQTTCLMRYSPTINGPDFTISSEHSYSVLGLELGYNKKISFLPVFANQVFPYLTGINAAECSIESISRNNFHDLKYLRILNLIENKIGSIASDVFEDLISLEELKLGKKAHRMIIDKIYSRCYLEKQN